MQATGIILLLAAGVIVLFGQDGSFVPAQERIEPAFEIKVIASDMSELEV